MHLFADLGRYHAKNNFELQNRLGRLAGFEIMRFNKVYPPKKPLQMYLNISQNLLIFVAQLITSILGRYIHESMELISRRRYIVPFHMKLAGLAHN